MGRGSDFPEGALPVGAGDEKGAGFKLDVLVSRFQQVCGNATAPGDNLACRTVPRR